MKQHIFNYNSIIRKHYTSANIYINHLLIIFIICIIYLPWKKPCNLWKFINIDDKMEMRTNEYQFGLFRLNWRRMGLRSIDVCSMFVRKCDNKMHTQVVKSHIPVRKEHSIRNNSFRWTLSLADKFGH